MAAGFLASYRKVVEKLKLLLTITDVLTINKTVILNALNSNFKDFEDPLQNYAAMKKGNIDVIVTRNLKDDKTSEINVLSPESYIHTLIS